MTYNSAYPILKLFISKTKKMENSSFLESLIKEFRLGLNIEVGKPVQVTSIRPQQESIDAFILTFRFFIQDNETISLRNLEKIFESNLATEKEKNEYYSLRSELKIFFSENACVEIMGDKPTNLDILHTVLFGELSHTNKEKKARYERWMDSSELLQEMIWHRFIISVMRVLSVIQRVKCLLCNIINRNRAVVGNIIVINYGNVIFNYIVNNGCNDL